jgi:general stress protein YciG
MYRVKGRLQSAAARSRSCSETRRRLCSYPQVKGAKRFRSEVFSDMAQAKQMRPTKTSKRGFAAMDQAKQRQIASKGGQSVPSEKRSFSKDPSLAAQAGRKGGQSVSPQARSFSQNRALAAKAGRKGGEARGAKAASRGGGQQTAANQ